ncbi:MAG: S8 family peptidase [Bacteroidota bacterium]|nr:S8 family peptidase [Bacteroidota bacterium]
MIRKEHLFLILFILFSGVVQAQEKQETNIYVHPSQEKFAAWLNQKWQSDQHKIQSIINSKKSVQWDKDSNGNIILCNGFSPSGLPEYLITAYSTPASVTVGTNQLWDYGSLGVNLSGNNSILINKMALWDGGRASQTHVELSGRINAGDSGVAVSGHSTSVAGIMIDKAINADARGMAYGLGGILSYDFYNDVAEMAAASPNLLLSNHSYVNLCGWFYGNRHNPSGPAEWEFWGGPTDTVDYNFGYYDDYCSNVDSIVFNAPFYTIVKAAGNNRTSIGPAIGGSYWRRDSNANWIFIPHRDSLISSNNSYDIIPTMGNAKNIITVGSVLPIPNGYTQPSDVQLTSYSSWGPTDDGRIKPDIVSPGENIFTASASSDTSYNFFGGTSAATPVVTGSLLLLQQLEYNLSKKFMHASTLKALVVHTANEAGTTAGPDYKYGWGLLNVEKAAAVILNQNYDHVWFERRLWQGRDTSFKVIAVDNGPMTFTICWTDPPGFVDMVNYKNNRTQKLVNDLDISVTDGASVFLPWALDVNNPSLPAVKKNNSVDNVEKIEIPNAIAGKEYTVTINHKGILRNGFQDYSFVASGINGAMVSDQNPLGLTVFPNPSSNNCTIRFKPIDNNNAVITISNMSGQKIRQEVFTPISPITNHPLYLNSLSKGIYLINLLHNNIKSTVKLEKL